MRKKRLLNELFQPKLLREGRNTNGVEKSLSPFAKNCANYWPKLDVLSPSVKLYLFAKEHLIYYCSVTLYAVPLARNTFSSS